MWKLHDCVAKLGFIVDQSDGKFLNVFHIREEEGHQFEIRQSWDKYWLCKTKINVLGYPQVN